MNKELFNDFIRRFPPDSQLIKPTQEVLQYYEGILPKVLLEFWKEYGFGNYGNGLIKVINPLEYKENLYEWLGKQDESKVPIMMSAFGELFYYRKLTEEDDDVSILDIHYRRINVCAYSFKSFVGFISDEEVCEELLREALFNEAVDKLGKLKSNEIFIFAPALSLGGSEEIEYVDKGDARTHQSLLF